MELPSSLGKGRAIGSLRIGSSVEILERRPDSYKVKGTGVSGWISKIQVAKVVKLDIRTLGPCDKKAPGG